MNALQPIQTGPLEAEYILLGSLIYDNGRIDAVADIITRDDFFEPFFGDVFALIVAEYSQGRAVTPITLRPLLADHPGFIELGGNDFLIELYKSETILSSPIASAKLIASQAKRRQLINGLTSSINLAADPAQSVEQIAAEAETALSALIVSGAGLHQVSGAECIDELLKSYEQNGLGVTCGNISVIDDLIGPMRPKQLIIGAGRPGMGKSAAAISYSLGAARRGHGVLFVSLEMSSVEIGARAASDLCFDGRSGVPFENIRDGSLTQAQMDRVVEARHELATMPFTVIDTGSITTGRLAMVIRRWQRRYEARGTKLEMVVVDYLQLLRPDQRRNSNYESVSEVSMALKAMAKDLGVAIFALAQLSREVEKRADKRPVLSDLRDSGQIEQDADAVIFLYRHEYYLNQEPSREESHPEHDKWRDAMMKCERMIDFICAKRRNGRTGSRTGTFYGGNQAVRG